MSEIIHEITGYPEVVPVAAWASIAYDITLGTDVEFILKTYNITEHQLRDLRENPEFIKALEKLQTELGDEDPLKVQLRAMVHGALPTMYSRMLDPETKPRDALAIFHQLTVLAGLDPSTNGEAKAAQAGPMVGGLQLNVYGPVEGLSHIIAEHAAPFTIDAEDA